jgi:hypothetical protein
MQDRINGVLFVLTLLAFFSPPAFSQSQYAALEKQAKSIATRMQLVLPLQSGSITLVRVDQFGIVVVYNHVITAEIPPENYPMASDWLRGQSFKSACSVPDLIKFVNLGGGLYYRFFVGDTMINETRISSCK